MLTRTPHALLMGDYDFCARSDPERHHVDPSLRERWPQRHPDDLGFTDDTTCNPMRRCIHGHDKHVRYDPIRLRTTGEWTVTEIALLGTTPLAPTHPDGSPLDHFGVCATTTKSKAWVAIRSRAGTCVAKNMRPDATCADIPRLAG